MTVLAWRVSGCAKSGTPCAISMMMQFHGESAMPFVASISLACNSIRQALILSQIGPGIVCGWAVGCRGFTLWRGLVLVAHVANLSGRGAATRPRPCYHTLSGPSPLVIFFIFFGKCFQQG